MQRYIRTCLFFVLIVTICLTSYIQVHAESFTIKRVGNLIPFNDNVFMINAPEKGKLIIKIHDNISVYRTIEQEVSKGETEIHWDGCAFNHEKLATKNYTVTAILIGDSGEEYSTAFNTPVEYTGQCLQYLLPSSGKVSLKAPEEWFVEFRTVQKGTVMFVFQNVNNSDDKQTYSINTTGGKINRLSFEELTRKKPLHSGVYHVLSYEKTKPEETYEFDITVQQEAFEIKEVFLTGEILPEEEMSEEAIWEIMQQPSVVVDIDPFKHQNIYSERDKESSSLGTLHGQTQALKVIRLEKDWAYIGAWNHEEAEYVEGWVPVSVLKVTEPNPDYGVLINKQEQTLDVYFRGKRIETLEVSTGRPEAKHPEQETAAGSFLTGYHRVDFSMNGKKYDYVIQYDGGNLLHQIPYEWGKDKKDFSLGRSYLGAKASHACIRIQSEPGMNGINAYWIWTHIPYHTRVIILDDPIERRPVKESPMVIEQTVNITKEQFSLKFEDEKIEDNSEDRLFTEEIDGHLVGYALCNEREYVKDPAVISERIDILREKGCKTIILKCFWNDQNAEKHTAVQEAMARKGAKAGAALVIGNGNKSLLGCEWKGNTIILYGLGNQKVNKTGKQNNFALTAEIIFDSRHLESKPIIILKSKSNGMDIQHIINRFVSDSVGKGVSQICFLYED